MDFMIPKGVADINARLPLLKVLVTHTNEQEEAIYKVVNNLISNYTLIYPVV